MKNYKLNNLRELTTEEQMRLNGGANSLCEVTCNCICTCKCNNQNPDGSTKTDCCDTGKVSVYSQKEKEAMVK